MARKVGWVVVVELRSAKKKMAGVEVRGRMHIHSTRGISDKGALVGDDN
jgi:hypothetical protein